MAQIVQFATSVAPRLPPMFGRLWSNRRAPRLDVNSLPDHLKRDIGLLGGRPAPLRDLFRD